jgi:hypothetical protein
MSPGTVFGVFWAVLIGAMRLGQAIPQVNVIVSAKLAAGEIFNIIDRVRRVPYLTKRTHVLEAQAGLLELSGSQADGGEGTHRVLEHPLPIPSASRREDPSWRLLYG